VRAHLCVRVRVCVCVCACACVRAPALHSLGAEAVGVAVAHEGGHEQGEGLRPD
jgi:hypothetical protein